MRLRTCAVDWWGVTSIPARDAQIILGRSRLAVTLEIYTHADEQAQREALSRLHSLFDRTSN
jgi:hypothetical protein